MRFAKGDHSDLADVLGTIDPASLSDEEWRNVCAGWKASGLDYGTFDAWCRRDPARYDERENRRRWDSFTPEGNANGAVGAGTVARIIEAHGGTIPQYANGRGRALKPGTRQSSTGQPTTPPPTPKADEIPVDPHASRWQSPCAASSSGASL